MKYSDCMNGMRLVAILFLVSVTMAVEAQNVIYVSPRGSDHARGSVNRPFRSIERAVAEARHLEGHTTIYLREGVYRPDAPIVFTPEDGGDGRTLCLRSMPGERAVLSGGMEVATHWQTHEGTILRTAVPPSLERMDVLLVEGESRPMARYPDYDSTAVRFNGTSPDATSPERVRSWAHPEGAFLHAMHASDWGDFHYRITGKDDDGNLFMQGGWQNNRPAPLHRENRMVEGIREELDAPGEWYHDTVEHILYYYPLPGEDMNQVSVETARLKHLIEFRGSHEQPVSGISIEGITLTQTARTFMEHYEPLLRSDWTVYRGGAVLMEGTEDCAIRGCDLVELGGNAIFISGYNRRVAVEGCHFRQIGASAVCLVGRPEAVRSPSFGYGEWVEADSMDRTPGPRTGDYPSLCTISDNLIHDIGRHEKQTTGVELSMCSHILVSHNTIYDTPRAGINVSEGTWGGHVIEHNDVFDTVKETGDHGAFNSWGRDRWWHPDRRVMDSLVTAEPSLVLLDVQSPIVLRHNRFRCDRGWDIDLDDGSSNYQIYDNLCLNGGIKLREGFFRRVENNIMVNNTFHPHVWFAAGSDVFVHNVVMAAYRPIQVNHWGHEVDYNVFADSAAYVAARSMGTDAHSAVMPVRFVNAAEGDFRLADAVAAARMGFHNFDMDNFGVLSPRLRSMARRPHFPVPAETEKEESHVGILWQGVRVKNLSTLGERSATGMDSERGVYVLSVHSGEGMLADYLRPNDVILRLGGHPVNTVDGLTAVAECLDKESAQSITLFRFQKEITLTLPAGVLKTQHAEAARL